MSIKLRSRWDQKYSYDETLEILTGFAWAHINKAGRFSDCLGDILRRRDWAALCSFQLDYRYDDNPVHLQNARQALGFFVKLENLRIPGVHKETVAWRKFEASERECAATNERFTKQRLGEFCFSPSVNSVLYGAQRKISQILGPVPRLDSLQFRFGPGANTSVKSAATSPRWKLGARLECSTNLIGSASALLSEAPHWAAIHACGENQSAYFVDVRIAGGRLMFVPKNAKTYRSIVVEPILNSFGQLGIGGFMKRRLALAGIHTDDQSRNQALARQGSVSGYLATVDIVGASDASSKELVASLLSIDWFTFLSQFRTGRVTYRKKAIDLEKFSSMGNGFTFELETLIFYALAYSVCKHLDLPTGWTTAYGDDIIIPAAGYPLLKEVLSVCGFSVNSEKSYADGPFRESCGKDYWRGIDIRPYYQKELVSGRTLFQLHNFYMRDLDFERARMVLEMIHPKLRLYGPDGYGDGHLIGDWSRRVSKKSGDLGWEGVRFDTLVMRPNRDERTAEGDCVAPLYLQYMSGIPILCAPSDPTDYFVVRGTCGYKRISIYTLKVSIYY